MQRERVHPFPQKGKILKKRPPGKNLFGRQNVNLQKKNFNNLTFPLICNCVHHFTVHRTDIPEVERANKYFFGC